MVKRNLLLLIMLFIIKNSFFLQLNNNQIADTLNKYDENGLKIGYWIEYLNSKFVVTDEIKNACFKVVSFYYVGEVTRNGKIDSYRVFPLVPGISGNFIIYKDSINCKCDRSNLQMVDGKFQIFNARNNTLASEEVYSNGLIEQVTTYTIKGKVHEKIIYDYNNRYIHLTSFDKKGSVLNNYKISLINGKILNLKT